MHSFNSHFLTKCSKDNKQKDVGVRKTNTENIDTVIDGYS